MIERAEFNNIVKHIEKALDHVNSWTGGRHKIQKLEGPIEIQLRRLPSNSRYTEIYVGSYHATDKLRVKVQSTFDSIRSRNTAEKTARAGSSETLLREG